MNKAFNKQPATRRLTILYICALSSVALLAILGQVIVQISLAQQTNDAEVINIAGRQRMLSQRLAKDALILAVVTDPTQRSARKEEMQQVVALWERSHRGLQQGDAKLGLPGNPSPEIQRLFTVIEPNFEAMLGAAQSILTTTDKIPAQNTAHTPLSPEVQTILDQESGFLVGMDQIVSQYQREAEGRVGMLKTTEITLLVITLAVLLLEGSFIFRPTTHKLNQTINEIMSLERAIAQQKQELELGIQQLLQTHIQAANGDFQARAPLAQDHVLWQIAYSLNNLLSRMQRLSLAEAELNQTKLEASRTIGSLQTQANLIKNELQLIQGEAAMLIDSLREAKVKDSPIRTPSSRTLLDPLYKELTGNYLQPVLPSGRG